MNIKTISLFFVAVLVLATLAGLARFFPGQAPRPSGDGDGISTGPARAAAARRADRKETAPIEIGVIGPWSLTTSPRVHLLRGIELACAVLNEQGATGRPLLLRVRDDHDNTASAARHLQELGEDPAISAVIGGIGSFEFQALRPLAGFNHLPLLSPTVAIAPDDANLHAGFSFSIATPYAVAIAAVQEFLRTNHLKTVAVISPADGEAGHTFCNAFDRAMPRNRFGQGGMVDRFLYNQPLNVDLLAAHLRFWSEVTPADALLVAGDEAVVRAVCEQVALMDKPPVLLVTGEITPQQLERQPLPPGVNVWLLSTFDPAENKPAQTEFVARYRQAYGEDPDWLAAQGYDAFNVLAAAIRSAGSTAPDQLVTALRQLDFTGNVSAASCIAFDACGGPADGRIVLQKVIHP